MQKSIHRASHRIGLVTALLCFLIFSLILPGGDLSLGVTVAVLVYCAFRLLGWVIAVFFSSDKGR
ncbi:hypothetical protein [Citrobacter sp. JGM124]|uniref:hypothetical protein n=1 Tax=Citrobacter sp. JGM124 TaxID=2799789 RepID=UPI001BA7F782|nr:hypothetical protein [Citrobacter sp. JGM124]MBS0847088.1 hypothetical protein [Citrobacter sp. JGM124]